MESSILINEEDLDGQGLSEKCRALLRQQISSWDLPSGNYSDLKKVLVHEIDFGGYRIKIQFNPCRITSSSAKVDKKSIQERKCFLCHENLPEAQKGILYKEKYLILCNPFPIFPEHLTIPALEHIPQDIGSSFRDMLEISQDLDYFTIFYNGPRCGASAPDHMHFQAGNKFFMPIDSEYDSIKTRFGNEIYSSEDFRAFAVEGCLRNFISFESGKKDLLEDAFKLFVRELLPIKGEGAAEPMMNLLAFYENSKWRIIIFPRGVHRPDYYFAKDEKNILLSPAAVDMGGVCITPLEKDFKKLDERMLRDIYRQISLPEEQFKRLTENFAAELKENL